MSRVIPKGGLLSEAGFVGIFTPRNFTNLADLAI